MFVSGSESLGNSVPVYCSGSTSFDVHSWKISLKNFQGLLSIVQLSMFFLLLPFHATAFILYQSVSCLSTTFLFFVLHLKLSFLMHQLVYNNIRFPECQALFSTFFTFSWSVFYIQYYVLSITAFSFEQNGERGIRTLAPLLTTYSLSRGAPSASLGISPNKNCSIVLYITRCYAYHFLNISF